MFTALGRSKSATVVSTAGLRLPCEGSGICSRANARRIRHATRNLSLSSLHLFVYLAVYSRRFAQAQIGEPVVLRVALPSLLFAFDSLRAQRTALVRCGILHEAVYDP